MFSILVVFTESKSRLAAAVLITTNRTPPPSTDIFQHYNFFLYFHCCKLSVTRLQISVILTCTEYQVSYFIQLNAQLGYSRLKFTLKCSYMFWLTNHHQGAYCRALLKLWILKQLTIRHYEFSSFMWLHIIQSWLMCVQCVVHSAPRATRTHVKECTRKITLSTFYFFTVVPCILILSSLLFYLTQCTTRLFEIKTYIKICSKIFLHVLVNKPSSGSLLSCFAKVMIIKIVS
jgi:hypothetical protein